MNYTLQRPINRVLSMLELKILCVLSESSHSCHTQTCLRVFCWALCNSILYNNYFTRNPVSRALNPTKPQVFSSLSCMNDHCVFISSEGWEWKGGGPQLPDFPLSLVNTCPVFSTWTSFFLPCYVPTLLFGVSWYDCAYAEGVRE